MPYVRRGKTVYKLISGHLIKKGTSKTIALAKKYLRKLYSVEK